MKALLLLCAICAICGCTRHQSETADLQKQITELKSELASTQTNLSATTNRVEIMRESINGLIDIMQSNNADLHDNFIRIAGLVDRANNRTVAAAPAPGSPAAAKATGVPKPI